MATNVMLCFSVLCDQVSNKCGRPTNFSWERRGGRVWKGVLDSSGRGGAFVCVCAGEWVIFITSPLSLSSAFRSTATKQRILDTKGTWALHSARKMSRSPQTHGLIPVHSTAHDLKFALPVSVHHFSLVFWSIWFFDLFDFLIYFSCFLLLVNMSEIEILSEEIPLQVMLLYWSHIAQTLNSKSWSLYSFL